MFNMTKLRENSKIIFILLLVFFVLSMVAGGLMGGASIMDVILGGSDPNRYAGWVENRGITHREFQNQYSNQLSAFSQQNRTIDGRTAQTASNNAWNTIVDNEFKNNKIRDLGLTAQNEEIWEFLFYTPPISFQNIFIAAGIFVDDQNNFVLEDYQQAVESGDLPEEFNVTFARWEAYLKNWLGNRKLQNLYNKASTVSDQEVKFEYLKNNINCDIDYIFININEIADSEISITNEEIKQKYNEQKDEKYKDPDTRTINYVSWKIPNKVRLDTLNFNSYIDSLNNKALLFADEADITSFQTASEQLSYDIDTLVIHEEFNNNSGFPFLMGTSRTAVRFIFDNNIGSISDPIQMENQILVINIVNEKSAGYRKFDDVSKSIKTDLMNDKKKVYAIEILNAKDSDNWSELQNENTLIKFLSNQTATVGSSFKDIGRSSEITGALLALNENEISNVISSYNTVCKIKVNSKDEFVEEKYNEVYIDLKKQLTISKNNSNYGIWLNDIKSNSTVNDFRSKTY